jgi:hypothetical protein
MRCFQVTFLLLILSFVVYSTSTLRELTLHRSPSSSENKANHHSCAGLFLQALSFSRKFDYEIEHLYRTSIKEWSKEYDFGVVTDIRLAELYERGDPHALMLYELGFRIVQKEGRKRLSPPQSFSEIYHNYELMIQKFIADGVIEEKDVIRPGLVFKKEDKFKIVDPLSDEVEKLLGDYWMIITQAAELPHEDWAGYMRDGRAIVQFGMLDHDLAHLTEYLQHPLKMKAVKSAYSAQAEALASEGGRVGSWKETSQRVKRAMILEEFFSLPDIRQREAIERLIDHLGNIDGDISVFGDYIYLKKLRDESREKFLEHIEELVVGAENIYLKVGGGLRDGYNIKRYATPWVKSLGNDPDGLLEGVFDMVLAGNYSAEAMVSTKIITGPQYISETVNLSAINTTHYHIEIIKDVSAFLGDSERLNLVALEYGRTIDDIRFHFENVLAYYAAKVEVPMHYALNLGVTPEKLVKQFMLGEEGNADDFFRRSYANDSIYPEVFLGNQ